MATSGGYIVKLKDDVPKMNFITQFESSAETAMHDWTIINGFAGRFDDATLRALRASPDVDFVEEDGIMEICARDVQNDAPWGLARLNQVEPLANKDPQSLSFTHTFDDSAGKGVDIYLVDTGVLVTHDEFGGRASWGVAVGENMQVDGKGHGTHCAGIAAGKRYGLAKSANIIAVKVLNDQGRGHTSEIITGLGWVYSRARSSGRPSVVSMSLGGGPQRALDEVVAKLTDEGIHVVVSAGNNGGDAEDKSPARVATAITVGSVDIYDNRASFSNFGKAVNIFAPGVGIISAWNTHESAVRILNGTSMATPYVTGLIAYLIGLNGNATPAAMAETLVKTSVKGVLSDIPQDTVNALAHHD